MAKLNSYVHVFDDEGNRFVFGPDDQVPAWAQKAITNKGVWEGSENADERATSSAKTKSRNSAE